MQLLSREDLPLSRIARQLVGEDHGGLGISFFFVEAPPGTGPALHTHPYAEVFLVDDGEALVQYGDEERTARGGDIVIVPEGTPHGFKNGGDGTLRLTTIHLSPRFITDWLE